MRTLRLTLGYSLVALANATGVRVSTITRYQNGSRKIPPPFARLVALLPRLALTARRLT